MRLWAKPLIKKNFYSKEYTSRNTYQMFVVTRYTTNKRSSSNVWILCQMLGYDT